MHSGGFAAGHALEGAIVVRNGRVAGKMAEGGFNGVRGGSAGGPAPCSNKSAVASNTASVAIRVFIIRKS